jgi:hypothetical protein
MNLRLVTSVCWLAVVASGCSLSTPAADPNALSSKQSADIDRLIRQVPFKTGGERMNTLRELSAYGPYAIEPVSKQMLASEDDSVRANGVYVLGLIFEQDRDARALDLIRGSVKDNDLRVRLEAARVLLEGGDRTGVPDLIAALDDRSKLVRNLAFETLKKSTRQSFGYDPDGTDEARAAAIDRYREHFARIDERG